MTRQIRLSLCALCCSLALTHAACIQQKCYEPPEAAEILEAVRDGVDDAADAMDTNDPARDALRARGEALAKKMIALRAVRAPLKIALIDEMQSADPDLTRARKLARRMGAPSVALYHEFVDAAHASILERTPSERAALVEHLREPFEPVEDSLLLRGGMKIALGQIDATDAQRDAVDKLKAKYLKKINALGRAMHRDREAVFKEILKPAPTAKRAHAAVDAGARRTYALLDEALADGVAFIATLSPAQRVKLKGLLDRARTCPAPP